MISVRNLRQRLNGNKIIIFLLFITSCSVTRYGNEKNTSRIPEKKNQPVVQKNQQPIGEENPSSSRKKEYTIALLLPFESKKVFVNNLLQSSSYYFPEESQLSVEYMNGAMLALDSLRKSGMKTKLIVYDTGTDTSLLKSALQKPDLKNADLIIGPVGISSLKLVCQFAKENKIWLLSPFSANTPSSVSNPNYVIANATLRSHCEKIYDYILKYEHPEKIFFLYRKTRPDIDLMKYFKNYKKLKNPSQVNNVEFVELTDSTEKKYFQIEALLSGEKKNIVIVASNAEPFVRTVMKQLSMLTDNYLIEVFGMPTWKSFDRIPTDQFEVTHTHITQTYLLEKDSKQAESFKSSYTTTFHINPTDYAVRGYDQLMYFGTLLLKGGNNLEAGFKKNEKEELAERFSIKPFSDEVGRTLYYENISVYFLKYDQGKISKIPD